MNQSIQPAERSKKPLPSGWEEIQVLGRPLYISEKQMIASAARPSKPPRRPSVLVNKETGTYVLDPQPSNLQGWTQAVALNPDRTGVFVFHNFETMETSMVDPRPKSEAVTTTDLPEGWTLAYDEDGDVFFVDHNAGTTTYLDPRLQVEDEDILTNQPGSSLAQEAISKPKAPAIVQSAAEQAYQVAELDHAGFNGIRQYLTTLEEIPAGVANKRFNRYLNILPNPETRVILEKIGGDDTTDYINANFISSATGEPRCYIASMGPLDATIPAFWRMIWENDVRAIAMTTSLTEGGKVKCARYWPTVRYNEAKKLGDKKYGDIRVAVLAGERHNGYIRTTLRVCKGDEARLVSHYWYTEWPDHGVPSDATNLMDMVKDVANFNKAASGGPIVVHCSAGIGRTGTFIAIDQATQLLDKEQRVDVLEVIDKLRQARGGMVQHPQQYEFVYKACIQHCVQQNYPIKLVPSSLQVLELSIKRAEGSVPPQYVHPSQTKTVSAEEIIQQKHMQSNKQIQELARVIAKGKPADMTDLEWKRFQRKWEKLQARVLAENSVRRRLNEAELAGELRFGSVRCPSRTSRTKVDQVF